MGLSDRFDGVIGSMVNHVEILVHIVYRALLFGIGSIYMLLPIQAVFEQWYLLEFIPVRYMTRKS